MDWRFSSFLIALLAILFSFTWAASEPGLCGSPYVKAVLSDATKDGALNCFDFWLNRYQTLLTGIVAIAAAAIAWMGAKGQIATMKAQNMIALGDLPTVFIIEPLRPDVRLQKTKLHIINENRRALEITAIEIASPDDVLIFIYNNTGNRLVQLSGYPYASRYNIKHKIEGTRPSAPSVSSGTLEIWVTWKPDAHRIPNPNEPKVSINCMFYIDYRYIGGDQRHERTSIDAIIELGD